MVITREADCAIRLMLVLSRHDADDVLSPRVLSEQASVPYERARGILARPGETGLFDSHRGRSGGYRLARAADEITIGKVLRVAGEHLEPNLCVADPANRPSSDHCGMHPARNSASELLRSYLSQMTLQQVAEIGSPQDTGATC